MVAAGTLILGYGAFKAFERFGGRMSKRRLGFGLKVPSPEKLDYDRVTLDVAGVSLLGFIRSTAQLRRLGFLRVADFTVVGWPDTFLRGFVHREKPVYAVIVEHRGHERHLELTSIFEDLSALTTSTSGAPADASRPGSLRFHPLPDVSVDEFYLQHLSTLESLQETGARPQSATLQGFFPHHRDLLVIEHTLRKAKRVLRVDTLQHALDELPALRLEDLLKRAESSEQPVEAFHPNDGASQDIRLVVETAKTPSVESPHGANSLLAKRLAARQESERILAPVAVESVDETPVFDLDDANAPFERNVEPSRERAIEADPPVQEAPRILLPFEIPPDEVATLPVRAEKPLCPHCGATLFSSLSSRCSKCKQAVR